MARAHPHRPNCWIEEAPSNEEAIEYVTMNKWTWSWSNEAKEYYYAKRAAALGVEPRQRTSMYKCTSSVTRRTR